MKSVKTASRPQRARIRVEEREGRVRGGGASLCFGRPFQAKRALALAKLLHAKGAAAGALRPVETLIPHEWQQSRAEVSVSYSSTSQAAIEVGV